MESNRCRRRRGMMLAAMTTVGLAALYLEAAAVGQPRFEAMFVFGDSLIDPGNNNYLVDSLAKANYVPYGVDFQGPTGRFCNGKTLIDYLGELLEFPLLPAFTDPTATGRNILRGINYASAAAGILEETGRNLGERFTFSQQIQNFQDTLNELKSMMGAEDLKSYLNKSLVVISIGSNDYINNYLQPSMYTSSYMYNPTAYADMLIKLYSTQVQALHGLGVRKFLLAAIGPLGCIPYQLETRAAPQGKCVSNVNDIVGLFNSRVRALVDQLTPLLADSILVYGNTFAAVTDIIDNAATYGFTVKDRGCCGISRQITCLPLSVPCADRSKYVFWDSFHPTQAVNQIIANHAYAGPPSVCYPMNVQQLAQLL
ncbi:GDSL esterase/lipase At5g08460-like [Ipomoea triloba]|uniref:GDSL esterase/lipase At5g08460-like n=1 Tax=Ipomoea triloba TaxID=35885 RepID=UPI00125DADAA|nr:GDSL esterase/lipase At5g08460-like [Ipomoea triloba]